MELRFPGRPPLTLDRPRIAGILNVTPDSFSDGGRYASLDAAVAHGLAMARDGAAIIDVGGESTRPGSQRVPAEEQIARVVESIRRLRAALDSEASAKPQAAVISIDTTRAAVAEAALDAGVSMLNDVSAGREDPAMLTLAADRGAPIVLVHMLGEPATMQEAPRYADVVAEVEAFLLERAAAAERAGVPRSQVVLDPGIGFGKTLEHNVQLLAALPRLVATGYAVMLGASRKRFLAALAGDPSLPPEQREAGTLATTALGVLSGAQLIRVHDVGLNHIAAQTAFAVREAASGQPRRT